MKTRMMMLGAIVAAAGSAHAGSVVVQSGFDATATKLGEAKARSFGSSAFGNGNVSGFELSLDGADPFLPAAETVDFFRNGDTRSNGSRGNAQYLERNNVTLSYDAAGNSLSFTVVGSHSFTMNTAFNTSQDVNYLQMTVAGRTSGVTVRFENVEIDGTAFGDFDANGGFRDWNFTGDGLVDGFTLTGELVIGGQFTKTSTDELNRLGFNIGSQAVVIPLPTTAGLGALGLVAVAARRRR